MSDFYNKYPYTDFHELNLDWVIERVKKLTEDWLATQAEWNDTEEQWQQLHDYVMNYFDNLDVSQEINDKIDAMVANGTFLNIIRSTVVAQTTTATENWLAAHISQPTTPVVDTSLTIPGAAADAAAVGANFEKFNNLTSVSQDYCEMGSISSTDGTSIELANRLRSGYIKPDTVPFTVSTIPGYSMNLYTYDESLNFITFQTSLTTITITQSNRYFRLVLKPANDLTTLLQHDMFTSYFSTNFDDCLILGTYGDLNKIRSITNTITDKKLIIVDDNYTEFGSVSISTGLPVNAADRIRSGYIRATILPFTITVKSGYNLNIITYDLDFNMISSLNTVTTWTVSRTDRYFRIVIKPNKGSILYSTILTDYFTNDFTGCIMLGTASASESLGIEVNPLINDFRMKDFSINRNLTDNTNMVWEYQNWVFPQVLTFSDIRNNLYYGFTNEDKYSGIAQYNFDTHAVTKTYLKKNGESDDHNLLALTMLDNNRLLCVFSGGHNTDRYMYIRRALARESIESFDDVIRLECSGTTTYAQIFKYNSQLYLFYRVDNAFWYYRVGNYDGSVWSDETRLIKANIQYYCQFTETTSPGVLRLCCYSNPGAGDTNIRMGYLQLSNMTLYDTDNATVIGTSDITPSQITVVIPIPTGKVNRLFNAAKTAVGDVKILYCEFTLNIDDDGKYYIYDNGTVTEVANAGLALWPPKAQLGIAWIGTNKIAVARNDGTNDIIELYNYSGNAVTLDRVVAQHGITGNYRTARPMIDDHNRVLLFIQGFYDIYTFNHFAMDSHIYDLTTNTMLV